MKDIEVVDSSDKAMVTHSHWADYAGQGLPKNESPQGIPFVRIVQAMSPSVENGAKPGSIEYSLDSSFYAGNTGVLFVPAVTRHVFVEWRPRAKGGGFIAHHDPNSDAVKEAMAASTKFGKYNLNEHELVETFYVYGVLLRDEVASEAAIAFSSTKVKPYKTWMARAKSTTIKVSARRTIIAPLFSHTYRLTTAKESNSFGNYWNWRIAQEAMLSQDSDTFLLALGVRDLFNDGTILDAHEPDSVPVV